VTLTPRELAPMITSEIVTEAGESSIVLTVTPAAVEEHVVPVAEPLLRDPRNASFEAPRTPPRTFDPQEDAVWRPVPASVSIIAGREGTTLDVDTLATELTAAVRAGERRIEPELDAVPPPFSTQDAEDAGVDHLLSTFTTYHACCQTRVTNIQRLAELVDDTTVMPGEQFSVNQISGVRTCEKGFAEAGMILDGEIVDVCGGGVSQFGTTTVNAVFFAGLDPDAYKPHSFYISRYPMAREATLNYPSPDIDVRFTNDTGAPIIVRTTYTSTSITVSFYGNPTASEVRADLGSIYNVRPYETERRVNRDLPPGTTTTVQSGADGFSVGLTRTIVREGGGSDSDDWTNTYVAKKEIIEYNPDPAPAPSPSPTTTDG
jgi:vancomycin resistance protein YoaR